MRGGFKVKSSFSSFTEFTSPLAVPLDFPPSGKFSLQPGPSGHKPHQVEYHVSPSPSILIDFDSHHCDDDVIIFLQYVCCFVIICVIMISKQLGYSNRKFPGTF